MWSVRECELAGLFLLEGKCFHDHRGSFLKVFQKNLWEELNLEVEVREVFFSTSGKGVLRGMHFQEPPSDHTKLVCCLKGKVLDVVLDLRRGSPTFGKWQAFTLEGEDGKVLFIPSGFAHGFLAEEEDSQMLYLTSCEYDPERDRGVRWDSFGFSWPVSEPIVSERDQAFPSFSDYSSPFVFRG